MRPFLSGQSVVARLPTHGRHTLRISEVTNVPHSATHARRAGK